MENFINLVIAGLVSGSVISAILGLVFQRRARRIEEEIRTQFQRFLDISRSRRAWKEKAVSELLGPVTMQLDRTCRAFARWKPHQHYLEAKVIGEGNRTIRDLLLQKGHLIPRKLLVDAGRLIEHYDYWLEKFEEKRRGEKPDLETPFIFAGVDGYPFPADSAQRFREAFLAFTNELYEREPTGDMDAA